MADVRASTYVRTQQRAWGEVIGYDALLAWSDDIVDIDRLVGELYRGELAYADFAVEIGMHQGLVALHPGDSWTTMLWSIFLGRTARADEVARCARSSMPQHPRSFCDRGAWWNQYAYYQGTLGGDEQAAVADRQRVLHRRAEAGMVDQRVPVHAARRVRRLHVGRARRRPDHDHAGVRRPDHPTTPRPT